MTYRVLTGMYYPTDPKVYAALVAAQDLPDGMREAVLRRAAGQMRRVEAGDVVDDLPAGAVAGLLAQGVIEGVKRGDVQ